MNADHAIQRKAWTRRSGRSRPSIFVSGVLDACSVTVYSEAAGYLKLGCLEVDPRGVPTCLGPKARKRAGHRVGWVVVSTSPWGPQDLHLRPRPMVRPHSGMAAAGMDCRLSRIPSRTARSRRFRTFPPLPRNKDVRPQTGPSPRVGTRLFVTKSRPFPSARPQNGRSSTNRSIVRRTRTRRDNPR